MARYEHLPIYKKAMDLAVYLEKVVRNFSRYHKYTLGAELRQKSREIVTAVIAANSRPEQAPLLLQLRQGLEALQVLLRIAREVRAFASGSRCAILSPAGPQAAKPAPLRQRSLAESAIGPADVWNWPFCEIGQFHQSRP